MTQERRARRLVVIGAGNIGSELVDHVARAPVDEVLVIDRDRYEPGNLAGQSILARDVGRAKAEVQKERLLAANPGLRVEAVVDELGNVPRGRYRAAAVLSGVDSLDARLQINEIVFPLGVPWIDAGVNATDGLYARVSVFIPGRTACMECGWDQSVYDRLEQERPCLAGRDSGVPTNAPTSLGALAAGLQAVELGKLLSGDLAHLAAGKEILLDARSHKLYVTSYRLNPGCRFSHERWRVAELRGRPAALTFREVLERGMEGGGASNGPPSISVEGHRFCTRLVCVACGRRRSLLRLPARRRPSERVCPACGGELVPVGLETHDRLPLERSNRSLMRRTLANVGLRRWDIVTVSGGPGGPIRFEITGDGL